MPKQAPQSDFSDEEIAQAAHNLNASIRGTSSELPPFWHELSEDAWQKEDTFRQINLLRENPGVTAERDHETWRKARLDAGWMFGESRDDDQKLNPLLVDWEKLPFIYRARSEAGFQVIRIMLGLDKIT